MIAAGRTLLAAVGSWNRVVTVTPLTPAEVENPNFPGQTTLDWSNATEGTPVGGILQPVQAEAAERLGIIGKVGVWAIHTGPLTIQPEGRVRISSTDYRVLEARAYTTHTELVVEEVGS